MADRGDPPDRLPGCMLGRVERRTHQRPAQTFAGALEMNVVGTGDQQQHRLVAQQKHHRLHDRAYFDAQRRGSIGGGVCALRAADHHTVMAARNQSVGNMGCIRMK